MVCAKCSKAQKKTSLATPDVKRKNELYHGSPASASTGAGISKNKLLSKSAKNPYAAYGGSCETCKGRTEQGKKFCHRCAFKANACAMCGKKLAGEQAKGTAGAQVGGVSGQRFSAK